MVGGRRHLRSKICAQSDPPHLLETRQLRHVSAYNVSVVRDSEKVQLCRIESRPRAFQRAIDGVGMLLISPPVGGSKSDVLFFVPPTTVGVRKLE